ncbi:MAG TPA: exodeoxyribonuclease VII small subunit [Methylotenera sp.]|nr:exodeoxyribonuclease VII small subunit [Methylotenera sp.]
MSASKTEKSATSSSTTKLEPAPSYEQAFSELEQIVAQMESGQMSLEDALSAYKRGNTLLEFCQKSLADVEQQVKILNERQQLTPFNADNE